MKTEKQKTREAASFELTCKMYDALEAEDIERDGVTRVVKARARGQASVKVPLDEAERLYRIAESQAALKVWCCERNIEKMHDLEGGAVRRKLDNGEPLDFDGTGEQGES